MQPLVALPFLVRNTFLQFDDGAHGCGVKTRSRSAPPDDRSPGAAPLKPTSLRGRFQTSTPSPFELLGPPERRRTEASTVWTVSSDDDDDAASKQSWGSEQSATRSSSKEEGEAEQQSAGQAASGLHGAASASPPPVQRPPASNSPEGDTRRAQPARAEIPPTSTSTQGDARQPQRSRAGPADFYCTTVMVRDIPAGLTRDMLTKLLDGNGFWGSYNLAYVPIHWADFVNFGYAFINFVDNAEAVRFMQYFTGFSAWPTDLASGHVARVEWSTKAQGLWPYIARYRNSPVMHPAHPDALKPALFYKGRRVAFPPPQQLLREPPRRKATGGAH